MNLIDRDKLLKQADKVMDIGNDFYSDSKESKSAFEHGVMTLKLMIKNAPLVNTNTETNYVAIRGAKE